MNLRRPFPKNKLIQLILFVVGIFCLSLVAIQPFTLNQMPQSSDGILQLHRVAAVNYSLRVDNPLWIRYSSGIAYGYGAPLFNFFPPLSYYLGNWLHTLGLSFVQSWLTSMMIYTLLAASGMYLLGRIWTQSPIGGWIAAIAYVYSPYFLFDSVSRGIISEFAALSILPFVLWGFTRLAFYGRRIDFVLAVGAYIVFIPMHTIMTLHGTGLLILYCGFLWLIADDKRGGFLRLICAGVLGLGATAFFWMPALLETDNIKINLITQNLPFVDVTNHLRPLTDILAFPFTADPTQMAQPVPITLSWLQIILALFGLSISFRQENRAIRYLLLFLFAIVILMIFMQTPTSVWLWKHIPFIAYTQFAWRMMGFASLALALMTGIAVWFVLSRIRVQSKNLALFCVFALILMSYSIPWVYSSYLGEIKLDGIRDVQALERETGQLTVSSYSEYLPIATDEKTLDPNRLIERFEKSEVIPRLTESEDLKILSADWQGTSAKLKLQTMDKKVLVFDWLYIDGWRASIDGENATVYPFLPQGLVAVDVPAGEFDLQISLGATAVQSRAELISLLAIVGIFIVLAMWRWLRGISNAYLLETDSQLGVLVGVIVLGIGLFLFKAIVLDNTQSGFKNERFANGIEQGLETPLFTNFANQIDLLGVDLPKTAESGKILRLNLYWQLHEGQISTDYSSNIKMRDKAGNIIAESGSFEIGGLASSNWVTDAYIQEVIDFQIPEYTAPMIYQLEIGLYDPATLEQLNVINELGNPVDVKVELGTIFVDNKLSGHRLNIPPSSQFFGIYLPESNFDLPDAMRVGDEFNIQWTWQNLKFVGQTSGNLARLSWIDQDGDIVGESKSLPLVEGYLASNWKVGDVFTGYHRVIVPADLPSGTFKLYVQLVDGDANPVNEPFDTGEEMTISIPERNFEAPDFEFESNQHWSNGIELLGYDMKDSGDVTLFWLTTNLLDSNLRLFVHVLDETDLIVAQSDGIPVDWTRPTTGWIPEEFIMTSHHFDLEDGNYRIRVGWYDPITGDRVTLVTVSDDFLILDEILQAGK